MWESIYEFCAELAMKAEAAKIQTDEMDATVIMTDFEHESGTGI